MISSSDLVKLNDRSLFFSLVIPATLVSRGIYGRIQREQGAGAPYLYHACGVQQDDFGQPLGGHRYGQAYYCGEPVRRPKIRAATVGAPWKLWVLRVRDVGFKSAGQWSK